MAKSTADKLTEYQCRQISGARALAEIPIQDIPATMGADPDNLAMAYGMAFGEARVRILDLLAIVDELTGGEK